MYWDSLRPSIDSSYKWRDDEWHSGNLLKSIHVSMRTHSYLSTVLRFLCYCSEINRLWSDPTITPHLLVLEVILMVYHVVPGRQTSRQIILLRPSYSCPFMMSQRKSQLNWWQIALSLSFFINLQTRDVGSIAPVFFLPWDLNDVVSLFMSISSS